MFKGTAFRSFATLVLVACLAFAVLHLTRDTVCFRVDDHGHLKFSRLAILDAGLAAGGSPVLFARHLLQATVASDRHIPHVNTGRPTANLAWTFLWLLFGDEPPAYQTVMLLLTVLLAVALAEWVLFLSRSRSGAVLAGLLFVSCGPVYGLLTWISQLNLLLGLLLVSVGLRLTAGGMKRGRFTLIIAGAPFLLAALLARQTEGVTVFGVLFVLALNTGWLNRTGREGLALRRWALRLVPVLMAGLLMAVLWLVPAFRSQTGEGQSVLADPPIALCLVGVTFLAQMGTMLKSIAWFLILPLAFFRIGPDGSEASFVEHRYQQWVFAAAVVLLLVLPGGILHVTAAVLVLVLCVFVTKNPSGLIGVTWAACSGLPILLYGAFSGRYAVEPLFGICLALGPMFGAAARCAVFGPARGTAGAENPTTVNVPWRWWGRLASSVMMVLLCFQMVFNLWPDRIVSAVSNPAMMRLTGHFGESLIRMNRIRAECFDTFCGRVPGGWRHEPAWKDPRSVFGQERSDERYRLWCDLDGRYLRVGTSYTPMSPELPIWAVRLSDRTFWEWNEWFWRPAKVGKSRSDRVPIEMDDATLNERVDRREKKRPAVPGGFESLLDACGAGQLPNRRFAVNHFWHGVEWPRQRLISANPECRRPAEELAILEHFRARAVTTGATEAQALALFDTYRLFLRDNGWCDAYELYLLERMTDSW